MLTMNSIYLDKKCKMPERYSSGILFFIDIACVAAKKIVFLHRF
jgi:hypothetical protein